MKPKIVRSVASLRRETRAWRKQHLTYAVVPTMGALHEGHLTLVREGLNRADRCIATIFVNPKQFAATEDLGRYPRDEEADVKKLAQAGCTLIFAPTPEDMYPPGFSTTVSLAGPAKAGLEDRFRPQFFDGVATVVSKLFIQIGADFAMFGEKDYQQLMVVTQMARDLDIPIEVVGIPTVREDDGLAMSSRNRYLSAAERRQAIAIHEALMLAAEKIRAGIDAQTATRSATRALTTQGFRVDYVTARNAATLAVPDARGEPLRLLAAAWLGKTRLIDNIAV
ncbi:MAG: pantoate--beta-alanine ligase [Hyphomicrobiales bacterium]